MHYQINNNKQIKYIIVLLTNRLPRFWLPSPIERLSANSPVITPLFQQPPWYTQGAAAKTKFA